MSLTFEKISSFEREILYRLLVDGYSFDNRWKLCFEKDVIHFPVSLATTLRSYKS